MNTDTLRAREAGVEWWTQQADGTERLRRVVWFVPFLGLVAAALLQRVHPLLGAIAMASATLLYLLGMRRTSLRRLETEAQLREAREKLRAIQQDPS